MLFISEAPEAAVPDNLSDSDRNCVNKSLSPSDRNCVNTCITCFLFYCCHGVLSVLFYTRRLLNVSAAEIILRQFCLFVQLLGGIGRIFMCKGPFTPSDSVTVTVMLTGGTFDLWRALWRAEWVVHPFSCQTLWWRWRWRSRSVWMNLEGLACSIESLPIHTSVFLIQL